MLLAFRIKSGACATVGIVIADLRLSKLFVRYGLQVKSVWWLANVNSRGVCCIFLDVSIYDNATFSFLGMSGRPIIHLEVIVSVLAQLLFKLETAAEGRFSEFCQDLRFLLVHVL